MIGVEMGRDPDAVSAVDCYANGNNNQRHLSEKDRTMNVTDLALMSAMMLVLAVLRFGVPMGLTWLIGKAADRIEHAA